VCIPPQHFISSLTRSEENPQLVRLRHWSRHSAIHIHMTYTDET